MIKCNVTVCGTISRVATVRTNSENKVFTAFAVNCVVPAKSGINKTVEISVAKDGEDNALKDFAMGQRVNVSGTLTFKKRGDNLYFNLSASEVTLSATNEDSIKGEMHFRGKTGKTLKRRPTRKARTFYSSQAFPQRKSMTASNTCGYGSLALTANVKSGCNPRQASRSKATWSCPSITTS